MQALPYKRLELMDFSVDWSSEEKHVDQGGVQVRETRTKRELYSKPFQHRSEKQVRGHKQI